VIELAQGDVRHGMIQPSAWQIARGRSFYVKGNVPESATSCVILITDVRLSEAEDHLRVFMLRSEPVVVALEANESKNREEMVLVPLVELMVLAEETLFRAFPTPPLPITT